jgi:NAD-dependent DNA ligase
VFTGELNRLSRSEAEELVTSRGGLAGNSVSRQTDYVVVGDAVLQRYQQAGETTGKLAKAVQLSREGAKLRIIGKSDFLAMLK